MKTVLCFGNELVPGDSLAKEIADELKTDGVDFIRCESLNDVLNYSGDIFILDVAKGIEDIKVFDDIDKLKTHNMVSLHDFDLGYFLKLMKETGKIEKIKIIAIPINFSLNQAKEKLKEILR